MDVEAGRNILKGTLETFDMGIELADMVLKSLDPALLLAKALATFLFTVVDKFCNVVGQPFVLHVVDIGKGGADGGDDGRGEGSRM